MFVSLNLKKKSEWIECTSQFYMLNKGVKWEPLQCTYVMKM